MDLVAAPLSALVSIERLSLQLRAILTLCSATGIMPRTFLTRAGSILAETIPTPSEALATTWPQGAATREWPYVCRCSLPTVNESI